MKTLNIEGKTVKLQIWDTSGTERFRSIISPYLRGTHGIFLVYDITNRDSFLGLNSRLMDIENYAPKNVYKILIGNKCDLESQRKVTIKEGRDFAAKYGMKFFEASAKEPTNVSDAFLAMTRELIKSEDSKEDPKKKQKGVINNIISTYQSFNKSAEIKKVKIQKNDEININKDELNKLKEENKKLKEENNKLKNDLQKANKTIQNLMNHKNINNNEIMEQLKKEIRFKDNELNRLKIELDKEKNKDNNKFVNYNDIMIVYFTSMDQKINKHGIKCLKTDTFAEIEEKLYQDFEDDKFRDTNNIFIANGGPILRFKKLYENKIKDGDIIQLIKN